jgi:cyanophycinase
MLRSFLLWLLLPLQLGAQSYTSFLTGDTADVSANPTFGLVLAGGAGDNDQAMQWMLERADGGDVVVIRASGSDGYNEYLYDQLGVEVNSVETIRFEDGSAAEDAYVLQQIRHAECLFIAGGDQYDYYQYWKDSPVEDAINYLLNEKQVPVGGISAGMAILCDWYYTPSGSSLTDTEALSDPYHPDYEILGQGDFLQPPFMERTITDTHYEQRDRPGRQLGFLARMAQESGERSFGIAANEYTAVCIDENGMARAFGEYPEYVEDQVFFLQANCQDPFLPEIMEAGSPLTWDRGRSAIKVYAIPARTDGSGQMNLNDWQSAEGGEWQNWYAENGELFRIPETSSDCAEVLSSTASPAGPGSLHLFPNPTSGPLHLRWERPGHSEWLRLKDSNGRQLRSWRGPTPSLDLSGLPPGLYILEIYTGSRLLAARVALR